MADERPAETEANERFRVLLEGLRTTLPGVTVLLAFLLTMPLQGGFADITGVETGVYVVALVGAAVTIVLLLAPTAHQYLRAPSDSLRRRHPDHVMVSVRLAIAGTVTLSITVVAATFLAADVAIGSGWGAAVAAGLAVLAGWAWFWLPLVTFPSDDDGDDDRAADDHPLRDERRAAPPAPRR